MTASRTYPLSTQATTKAGDLNFDGFADRILMGLESEVGVGLNDVAVFAPGEPFVPALKGVKALDDDYLRFWHEVGEYAKDPEFFEKNTARTTRPLPGHVFHDEENPEGSYVDRKVNDNSDGTISIGTDAAGTGSYPTMNEWLGPSVFSGTDQFIIASVEKGPLCENTPKPDDT